MNELKGHWNGPKDSSTLLNRLLLQPAIFSFAKKNDSGCLLSAVFGLTVLRTKSAFSRSLFPEEI